MHLTITGALDYTQNKGHIPHAFSLPAGTTRLSIQFDYSPKISRGETITNELSLTLFDPDSARGARHNNRDRSLTITQESATPGYIPGLQPGTWTVWIDSHRVLPPDVITYQFDIDISSDPVNESAPVYTPGATAPRGAGWYRGDLHGHTLHSDGRWDVPGLIGYARDYGLDFVTLSDHNTVGGLRQHVGGGDHAGGAGLVLHHHRLAERLADPLRDQASRDVARSAGGEAHQQAHGAIGERLGLCRAGRETDQQGKEGLHAGIL